MKNKDTETGQTLKTTAKRKPGSTTAIISLAMVIASITMCFLFIKEDEMHMVPGEGLLSVNTDYWVGVSGLLAIIFAFISLIRKPKWQYATIGFVSGVMGFLLFCLMPTVTDCREKARRISCASNLKQIGLGIIMYSQENNNQFPDKSGAMGFEMLRSGGYLDNVPIYTCPSTNTRLLYNNALTEEVDYVYIGGYNKNTPPDTVIAYDKPNNHYKFRNVLFADGHVSGYSGANWMDHRNQK